MSNDTSAEETGSDSDEKQYDARATAAMTQLEAILAEANKEKKWSAALREKAESLFTEILRYEPMEALVAIGSEIHQSVFESIIRKNWQKLKPDDKEEFVTELVKLNSEKGILKQIILADRISRSNRDIDHRLAVELLCGSLGIPSKGNALWPELPKYKTELLQKRFLLSAEGWPNFESDDRQKLRTLVAAFIETADDAAAIHKAKSKISLYGFAKWAGQILEQMPEDDPNRELMLRRIFALGETLPEWSSRIVKRHGVTPEIQTEGEINQSPKANDDVISKNKSTRSVKSNDTPNASSMVERATFDHGSEPARQSLIDSPFGPVTKQDTLALSDQSLKKIQTQPASGVIETIQTSIASMQVALDFVNQLSRQLRAFQQEKVRLEAQLKESQHQIAGLRTTNTRLEQDLTRITHQSDMAQGDIERLNTDVSTLREQLSKEQVNRAEDGKKFSQQIEREKEFVLNGLKGKLRGSLQPIFENKRTTDHQELSAELAGFFRHWFNEVEEKLRASGIQVS